MQRDCLRAALNSVADQTWPRLEVIVVNAKGGCHPALAPVRDGAHLHLVNQDGEPLDRPAAANLALTHARGEWLIFLDDDDLFEPEHVARLCAAVATVPQTLAAYAGVRLLAEDGRTIGVLDEPFDSTRLWMANFLPIHAVLFSRQVVEDGERFDESLPVYEDWDFWRRLSLERPFLHVPGVSATYRLMGSSGLSAQADNQVTNVGRRRFFDKWATRIGRADLTELATAAELSRASAVELGKARNQVDELQTAMNELQASLTDANAELQVTRLREEEVLRRASAAEAEYAVLAKAYRQMEGSVSWRLTAPLRKVRSAVGTGSPAGFLVRVLRALPIPAAAKQRLKVWLALSPLGRTLSRWLKPAMGVVAGPSTKSVPYPTLDKEAVRAEAQVQLTAFLAGNERLTLRSTEDQPQVSVIVVLYNQAGLSLLCLQALADSRGATFETIVVDNASTDRMPELLERLDGATILGQSENIGFLRAVNLAARQARGKYLLMLNNDAVVEPETLAHAVARLEHEQDVGAVGGPILLWDGRLQEAGSIVWRDGSCQGYGRGDAPDLPAYQFVRDVDYCSGAFLLVRRGLFEQLGGFDDVFAPAYYEETDFCVRLWEAGQRVVFDPKVRVKHFEFASDEGSGRAIELQTRNRARFAERHPEFLARRPWPGAEAVLMARQRLRADVRRVLFVDDRVPLPWLGQGYPRAASFVAAIVEQEHFVTHYPLQFPVERNDDVARALPSTCEVMLGLGLVGFAGFLAERRNYYDLLIVSRPHNMEIVKALRRSQPNLFTGMRIVYDAEALFSMREIVKAEVLGHPMSDQAQHRLIRSELALAEDVDAIVTVSDIEANHYRQAGQDDVHVLGHTVEVQPSRPTFEVRNGFLFVGAMTTDDSPNADSLLWFVREVWPLVCDGIEGSAVLEIVGSCDSPQVKALAGPTVRVRGKVSDLEPFFDSARVFLVPTRFAAGIPHKAHEAAARGLPMVVTPLIAEQLGWTDQVPVGSDAGAFAAHCVQLHRDANLWSAARERMLEAVQRDCDPRAFSSRVQKILGSSDAR